MGPVTSSTVGLSGSTFDTDSLWCGENYNSNDVRMTKIPATDFAVGLAADSLISEHPYRLLGVNSNAASQAIANEAAGEDVAAPNGLHPGINQADRVNFVRSCPANP